jgi:hypothetical protein
MPKGHWELEDEVPERLNPAAHSSKRLKIGILCRPGVGVNALNGLESGKLEIELEVAPHQIEGRRMVPVVRGAAC